MADLYYFSPTGGTKKAGESFCAGISQNIKKVDLGLIDREIEQPNSDLIVAAVPVFGGRIPAFVAEKLGKLEGKGKKAVTLVVYGNRAYEDALLELNKVIEKAGFQVTASAALIAQHSMVAEVGAGRPDESDRMETLNFAGKVLEKLESGIEKSVEVPGNDPYKKEMTVTATPISLPTCSQCKKCSSVCPTGAIELGDGAVVTDPKRCILCMACVAACPNHVRILPPPLQEKMRQMLGAFKAVRRENEYFL